jgi:hypothetical protein
MTINSTSPIHHPKPVVPSNASDGVTTVIAPEVQAGQAADTGTPPTDMPTKTTGTPAKHFEDQGVDTPTTPAADAPAIARFANEAASGRLDMLLVAQTLFACAQEMKTALNESKVAETLQAYESQLKEASKMKDAAQKEMIVGVVTSSVSIAMGGFQAISSGLQLKGINKMEKAEAAESAAKQAQKEAAQQAQKEAAEKAAQNAAAQNAQANRMTARFGGEQADVADGASNAVNNRRSATFDLEQADDLALKAGDSKAQKAKYAAEAAESADFAAEAAEEAARSARNSRADVKANLRHATTQAIVGLGNAAAGVGGAIGKYQADLDQAEAREWAAEATLHTAQKEQTEAAEQKANELLQAMKTGVQELLQAYNNTEQQIGRNFA